MPEISKFNGGFAGFTSINFNYGGGEDEAAEYVGSTMLFLQASAPTGWTQNTSFNDYHLKITSGNVESNSTGSPFSTLFGLTNINSAPLSSGYGYFYFTSTATSLTTTTIASHTHPYTAAATSTVYGSPTYPSIKPGSYVSGSSGSGGSHQHGAAGSASSSYSPSTNLALNLTYVDCIIAKRIS